MDINIAPGGESAYPTAMELAMNDLPALIFSAGSSTTTTTSSFGDDISWQYLPSSHLNWSHEDLTSPITFPLHSNNDSKLLHLLMAAAESLSGDPDARDLAKVVLVRLKELLVSTENSSSGIERLATHFADALNSLLDGGGEFNQLARHVYPTTDVLTAFQLLQDMSPFASFGHLTANQAILEAVDGERRVHIVDYDIAEGIQWASLIQAMASRNDGGAQPPHLKITAVTNGRRKLSSGAQEAGQRLSNFAASVGQPFSFRLCRLDQHKRFQPAAVRVVKGESVVVNCVLHPGKAGSAVSFLLGAEVLGARLVTVIEEDVGQSVGHEKDGFLGRFVVELNRYMAIWESLEAGFPKQGMVREMVERMILGPRIAGAVRRAYEAAEEDCGERMAAAGWERVELSFFNRCQARLLLGFFNEGYRVKYDGPNKMVLSWKSCRLISASVWAVPMCRSSLPSQSPAF